MIRINSQYLDLFPDTSIEIDRQVKLFESLEETSGDFSYTFDFPYTAQNFAALGFPAPDTADKTIYNDIPAEVVGKDGVAIYTGKLRIERINARTITASFFSGNYNWLSMIGGKLQDLDFSEYNIDLTADNIMDYAPNTEGLVFPLVDLGGLVTRSTINLKIEDFTGAIYVKTIFRKIFNRAGIKFTGDFLNDWLYNNTIILKNNKNQIEIEASSSFIEKSSVTNRPTELVDYKITFQNDTVSPYFDGENNLFDLPNSRFGPVPYAMTVIIECTLQASLIDANYSNRIHLFINGAFTFIDVGLSVGGLYNSATPGDQEYFTLKRTITLQAGDVLEIYSHWQESTGSTTPVNVLSGTLKITPVFIYRVFGNAMVPNWTQKDFVLSILNLFNVISDFDPISKTVTFNLFEKLQTKTPIDISQYIDPSTIETDFAEFISGFAKRNLLSYTEGEDEDLREYNIKEFIKYGAGVIEVDNDFIENEKTIIRSGFTSPISYIHNVFKASFERLGILQLEEVDSTEFTSVTDSSGNARFVIADDYFVVGDLVRIEECNLPDYRGDWEVSVIGAGYVQCFGLPFAATATGRISKLNHRYTNSDAVFILVHIPDYLVTSFSGAAIQLYLEQVGENSFSYAYFNLLNVGKAVNTAYLQGLSFGEVSNILSYQKTLTETYWRSVGRVLSDPVKVRANFYFPQDVFKSLSPLTPVYLKTKLTTNLYYINMIRGYKASHLPCEVELIKL